jgi:probable F420-dependent oxidoreductase
MEFGVQGLNSLTRIEAAVPLARLAEDLGYGSWWAQDHVALPSGPGAPLDPRTPIVDPLVHLAHIAAITTRMTLGTAILILPQRHPVVLAKQAASLDVVSGGRFVLGVGAGWLGAEMAAVGVPMADRGTRTDEYLDAMTSLWADPAPRFHGRYVDFADIDAHPRPAGIRVHVGGRSPGAYRRAVSRGHGFYGNGTPQDIAGDLDGLRAAARDTERPARLGRLEITAMPLAPVDRATVARYAELGVDRLVLRPQAFNDPDELARDLERHAALLTS